VPFYEELALRFAEAGVAAVAIDPRGRVIGMLLDDREDVREQPALNVGELRALDRGVDRGALQPVDRRP